MPNNKRYTATGYCNSWGSKMGARRVAGLTHSERNGIRAGDAIYLPGCPKVAGTTDRVIVENASRFYARIPTED